MATKRLFPVGATASEIVEIAQAVDALAETKLATFKTKNES